MDQTSSPLLSSVTDLALDSMLQLTRRNPTQAHHFTANQLEKCSISCKRVQPAEKQREAEQDYNVYRSGPKERQTVNKDCMCV